jgi:hypothetical protein
MGERRSFLTHAGAGGVESDDLDLPFKSTPCEDWYGFGDNRCPSRYIETGDIETDIISLKKWIGFYKRGDSYGLKDKLLKKQAEVAEIQRQRAWLQLSDEEQQRQQRLLQVNEMIITLESELSALNKTLGGFHAGHYIVPEIQADIRAVEEKIIQLQIVKERLAREEIIRTTAKPEETIIVSPPETVEEAVKYSPLLIAGIGIIVFIIIMRRRA